MRHAAVLLSQKELQQYQTTVLVGCLKLRAQDRIMAAHNLQVCGPKHLQSQARVKHQAVVLVGCLKQQAQTASTSCTCLATSQRNPAHDGQWGMHVQAQRAPSFDPCGSCGAQTPC
eukprot:1162033-Pelagomonas_calceolata.AAC.5